MRPVARLKARDHHHLLVEDARSTTAPERMTESNMTIESRTTAPTPTRTPGGSTEFTTVPSMTQPWLMRLRWTWASADLAGAVPQAGVDDQSLS
jgi:hypothetical protein